MNYYLKHTPSPLTTIVVQHKQCTYRMKNQYDGIFLIFKLTMMNDKSFYTLNKSK